MTTSKDNSPEFPNDNLSLTNQAECLVNHGVCPVGISLFYEQPPAMSRSPPPNQNGTIAKGR